VDKLDDATGRNLYATGGTAATQGGQPRRAQMPENAIKVYYRQG